jgi:hypothetical protein
MAESKSAFLVRLNPEILGKIKAWAGEDLRSTNGQIEYLLRVQLLKTGRLRELAEDESSPQGYDSTGSAGQHPVDGDGVA